MDILEYLWPRWKETPDNNLNVDTVAIIEANWHNDIDDCLDEARRIRDEETSRNSSTGNKAQIYIAALLGLIPVLLSMTQIKFFSKRLENLNESAIVGMVFFSIGVLHALYALRYAAKTMKVAAFHRVDVMDLINLSSSKSAKAKLIKEILLTVRNDRAAINRKVGFVKVTQVHIGRMAIMFLISLFFLTLWPTLLSLTINIANSVCVKSSFG